MKYLTLLVFIRRSLLEFLKHAPAIAGISVFPIHSGTIDGNFGDVIAPSEDSCVHEGIDIFLLDGCLLDV